MPQYYSDIATYYAEKHLTLAEKNEAYAAAVKFANDRGVSHLNYLAAEYAGRVTMKGVYVPTSEDRVLPLHCDPAAIAAHDESCRTAGCYNAPCDGSFTRTENGECAACGRVFCTDTNLPVLAEVQGEDECSCEGHCAVCRVSKDTMYYTALDAVLCPTHKVPREASVASVAV